MLSAKLPLYMAGMPCSDVSQAGLVGLVVTGILEIGQMAEEQLNEDVAEAPGGCKQSQHSCLACCLHVAIWSCYLSHTISRLGC
jgi:hypothetical protein